MQGASILGTITHGQMQTSPLELHVTENEDFTDTSRLYHTLNTASVTTVSQMSSTYNDRTPTYA